MTAIRIQRCQMLVPAKGRLRRSSLPLLSLAALGVVFGGLGTSPLYTFKTIPKISGSQARFLGGPGSTFTRPLDIVRNHLSKIRLGCNAHR